MKSICRHMMTLLFLMACETVLVIDAAGAEPVPDSARSVLQDRRFPWYDSVKERFRPIWPVKEQQPSSPNFSFPTFGDFGLAALLQVLMWLLLAALIVTLLVIVFRAMQSFKPFGDSESEPSTPQVDLETLEALPEPTRGVQDLLGEAARLEAQSLFGQAILFYYSWQLVRLNELQYIEVQKGKTNRQYSREIHVTKPDLLGLFTQSTRLFEDAFFGNLSVSSQDFQKVWDERERFADRRRRRS